MVIGALDSASSARSLRTVSEASASVTVPNTSTVRARKAFSSRKVLAPPGWATGAIRYCY